MTRAGTGMTARVSDEQPADDPRRERRRAALLDLAIDAGFDSASLFVRAADGTWSTLDRVGPLRPWHNLLSPETIAWPGAEGVIYDDALDEPRIGGQLAAMGCATLAAFPMEGRRLVILDSSLRLADPHRTLGADRLAALSAATPEVPVERPVSRPRSADLRDPAEPVLEVLASPSADREDVLAAVAETLGAAALYVADESVGEITILSYPPLRGVPLTAGMRRILLSLPPSGRVDDALSVRLADELSLPRGRVVAAVAPTADGGRHLLLARWTSEPPLARDEMAAIATTSARVTHELAIRRQAVDHLVAVERTRWAYEVHDHVTQTLSAAVVELETLAARLGDGLPLGPQAIERAGSTLRHCLHEIRRLLVDLSDHGSLESPNGGALRRAVDDLVRRWRIPARVSVTGDFGGVPAAALAAALAVIREGLMNTSLHSDSSSATVVVTAERDGLRVDVRENGGSYELDTTARLRRFGIDVMQRRVEEAGGTLDTSESTGRGSRVVALFPSTPTARKGGL